MKMINTQKSFLFIIRCTPFSATAKEALDAVLVAGAFNQKVSVLFLQEGIYHLLKDQQPELLQARNISASWRALPLYDIDRIYVCEYSLAQRSISEEKWVMPIELLSVEKIQSLMAEQHAIFTY